jgi:hypothetical protein
MGAAGADMGAWAGMGIPLMGPAGVAAGAADGAGVTGAVWANAVPAVAMVMAVRLTIAMRDTFLSCG